MEPVKSLFLISKRKAVDEMAFQLAVRNNLGRLANLIGLGESDREELQEMAHNPQIRSFWLDMLGDPDVRDTSIPEWVWNRHARAATHACIRASGFV